MIDDKKIRGRRFLFQVVRMVCGLFILLSIVGMVAITNSISSPGPISPVGDARASGGSVDMTLALNFETPSSGHLEFYLGNGEKRELRETDDPYLNVRISENDNLKRIYEGLLEEGKENKDLFRSVLDSDKPLDLSDFKFKKLADSGYFGLYFSSNFTFEDTGHSIEYEPLSFIFGVKKETIDSVGSAIDRGKEEDEMRDVSIGLEISLKRGLSLRKRSDGFGHWRTLMDEGFSKETNMFLFTKQSNEFTISDGHLLSPIGVFSMVMALIFFSALFLFISWRRHRFILFGWVLPGLAAMIAIIMLLMFFLPWMSLYSLGGGTILIPGALLLILVGATDFVHPRYSFKSYRDEAGEIQKIKPPKVVYVDRTVYVRVADSDGEREIDPYEVLEVSKGDSLEDIEKAYRQKVLDYHPDKYEKSPKRIHMAAKKEMENLNKAYEYFKDRGGS